MSCPTPGAGGHCCWPLAGAGREERCRCHVRTGICIKKMFVPWEIAQDRTLPTSLPIPSHSSQANESLSAHQVSLAVCSAGFMAVSPPGLPQPQACPHGAVTRPSGQGQWAVPCVFGGTTWWEQWGDVSPSPGHRKGVTVQCNGPHVTGDTGLSRGSLVHVCWAGTGTSAKAMAQGSVAAPRQGQPEIPACGRGQEQLRTSHGSQLVAFCPNSIFPLSKTEAGC